MTTLNDLFGAAGAKPKLITSYTSGTGTYVPTVDMARCRVRVQAGGAGGHSTNGGGGAGSMIEFDIRIPIAGLAYAVAAAAAVDTDGSNSTFGPYTAVGGSYPIAGSAVTPFGGINTLIQGNVSATDAIVGGGRSFFGVDGGMGGNSSAAGGLAGFPMLHHNATNPLGNSKPRWANGQGNNSGGNSFYGKGGTSGNPPAAGAYGAGGGMNAASLGGYIEIFDYGA